MLIELGSGLVITRRSPSGWFSNTENRNLRKVSILLKALEAAGKDVDYYALDLSLKELERTLEQVPSFKHVKCHGLFGTYDDGLDWLKMPENRSRPKCVMSLGSSIGEINFGNFSTFCNIHDWQETSIGLMLLISCTVLQMRCSSPTLFF